MKTLLAIALFSLSACGEQRPPAPTADEDLQLNEVESMLNEVGISTGEPQALPDRQRSEQNFT